VGIPYREIVAESTYRDVTEKKLTVVTLITEHINSLWTHMMKCVTGGRKIYVECHHSECVIVVALLTSKYDKWGIIFGRL